MFNEMFRNKSIFITGHTGFKGSWLCLWLHALGAKVTGYALEPPTDPSLLNICRIHELVTSINGDVRDLAPLTRAMKNASPEIVIHLAAQPIVRESYNKPAETYAVNVMGTVNLLEAVRQIPGIRAVVNVTTDKCYENRESIWGYRENEHLGGYDPYSSSKACSELVTAAYRNSFFNTASQQDPASNAYPSIATARAGNVIGGGDWGKDRLIPDCIRAITMGEKLRIRSPYAIRPWQHVLEPLAGYLMLAERLYTEGISFAEAWNFGPFEEDARPVSWIIERIGATIPGFSWAFDKGSQPHEANFLKLDSSKARSRLGWRPQWRLEKALDEIIAWHEAWQRGEDMLEVTLAQIAAYEQQLEVAETLR
jgi:CDP-glucose 4,6-dehydratase